VVYGQWHRPRAAVLTGKAIPSEDIASRQLDFLVWHPNICLQTNDAGEGIDRTHRPHNAPIARFDQFGFVQKQQRQGFLDTADRNWLVALVEDQHPPTADRWCQMLVIPIGNWCKAA